MAMATTLKNSPDHGVGGEGANGRNRRNSEDPFASTPTMQSNRPHRYSAFNTGLFSDDHPSSSPGQAKKALEAHLAETDRRLGEASKLGTTLVDQRQKLSARLREVESQQNRQELGPELRQRLVDIEKEYNELGRESARAFLGPRTDGPTSNGDNDTPFALDGRKPASPAKFSSQATDSPSKVNVPRKQRNQSSNQVHDIEFAAEISTSLLGQVRQLQGMLSEKDEALKSTNLEVSRLEHEAEGFAQRLRSLDESEQRYKDENWSLETQLHELTAEHKEATGREHKIQHALTSATSEKNAVLRELDDLKQTHGKTLEDHAQLRKNQDSELGSLRRDLGHGDTERSSLQRKIDDLTSQNQELAKAVAGHFRKPTPESMGDVPSDPEVNPVDRSDTDHSPPPSPTKGSQRHSMLESETLKSSLHHAHRMIQNLKGNVHREKTEKLELKRMLQDARDELDVRRSEGPDHKRLKQKSQQDLAKRSARPNMLGAGRNSRTDISVDEPGWEDRSMDDSPQPMRTKRPEMASPQGSSSADVSDAYQTANETEGGFETANERDYPTENEAVQAGAQDLANDSSDDMTETEAGASGGGAVRSKRPTTLTSMRAEGLSSFTSPTATATDDVDSSVSTPNQSQPQKYKVRVNRGSRRSRLASEGVESNPSTAKGSPASFLGTPGQGNQNLFAELDDLNADDSYEEGTPSKVLSSSRSTGSTRRSASSHRSSSKRRRSSVSSQRSAQNLRSSAGLYGDNEPPVPRLPGVDSGTMTEPWQPEMVMPTSMDKHTAPNETPTKAGIPGAFDDDTQLAGQTSQIGGTKSPLANEQLHDSPSTAKPTPPKTVWDQPLSVFQNIIPTFGATTNTTPLSAKSAGSPIIPASEKSESNRSSIVSLPATDGQPHTPPSMRYNSNEPESLPKLPEMNLSFFQGVDIPPVEPPPMSNSIGAGLQSSTPMRDIAQPGQESSPVSRSSSTRLKQGTTSRILGSIFGSAESPTKSPQTEEARISQSFPTPPTAKRDSGRALHQYTYHENIQRASPKTSEPLNPYKAAPVDTADHSVQTMLSADQIDSLIKQKTAADTPKSNTIPAFKPLSAIGATSPPPTSQIYSDPFSTMKGKQQASNEAAPLAKGLKKPISSNSMRLSNGSENHPPLPTDHQQAIAAAAQKTPATDPSRIMGPPLAPASAYRSSNMQPRTPSRPRTPNEQRSSVTPASKTSTTPRARHSTARSRVSRRSSVSSFESELDQRFNIRLDGMPMPDGVDSGTDPRMISAITQTMIGEFLWKYTRKAGRGEMSNNRHRRFFWVHPYTRTLYWSDRDPSTAGRAEMKAKSVAIEAVRVVADDNPMPPGLHRKSLVVVTPGRSVKFTAQTSQRHETWFNALSYLLLRTGPDGTSNNNGDNPGLAAEDLAEFNPNFGGNRHSSRATRGSRISLASFRSRGKTPEPGGSRVQSSQSQQSIRQPTGAPPPPGTSGSATLGQQGGGVGEGQRSRRGSASIKERISSYWKPNRGLS
ncbi:MAG: hypothetical protein Q9174_004528, partial [Haloplaca sp. 1 TL-2023]